ncbi:MAG: hypothetical protein SVU88_04240 [Candidatus Nanohaloarchaea archaeon]|nr:hypothetical protein [Candidatus Nanohaloarchaea archaeon]
MTATSLSTLRTGARSALLAAAVHALPAAQYPPISKWMAFSLLTVDRLEVSR